MSDKEPIRGPWQGPGGVNVIPLWDGDPLIEELVSDLEACITARAGALTVVAAVGALELVKLRLLNRLEGWE